MLTTNPLPPKVTEPSVYVSRSHSSTSVTDLLYGLGIIHLSLSLSQDVSTVKVTVETESEEAESESLIEVPALVPQQKITVLQHKRLQVHNDCNN